MRAFLFFIRMELLLLLRRSHEWIYPVSFFIVVISLFPLVFTPDPVFLQKYVSGCIWIAALFASLLSVGQLFSSDMEEGQLDQCLLSPSFSRFVFAKLIAQWIVTELPLVLITPILGFLFHLPLSSMVALTLSLFIGTPILLLLNSFGVALMMGLKQQGVLLALIIFPLLTPVIIFGVAITQQSQAGFSIVGPVAFLAGLCVLSMTLLPWVIAVVLKMGADE